MSTRSVSVGSAIAAFFCLSTMAGFAILVLMASSTSARSDDAAAIESRDVRQIEIHTKMPEDTPALDGAGETAEEEFDVLVIEEDDRMYQAERIILGIDRAQLLRLNGAVDTIVIGNPLIADAAVYDQSTLVLTGKAFGETNIIVIDHSGAIIREASIRVGSPNDVVVVNRGRNQLTYSCAPSCSRTLRIGDEAQSFDATLNQTQAIIDLNSGNGVNR